MVTQVFTAVRAAETVGTQYTVIISRYISTNLFSKQFHIVSGSHCRRIVHHLSDVRNARGFQRVQHVPTLTILAVTRQFSEGGHAVDVRAHAVVFRQDLCGFTHVTQDRTGAQQLNFTFATFEGFEFVDTFTDTFLGTFRHGRHVVVFVQGGDVVVNVLLRFTVHALQTIVHDDRNFIRVRRIVRDTVRDSQRLNVAVAIFVLQTFAVQRRTTRSTPDQEAARLLVTRCPAQVADTLETEHGVVDVERDHRQIVGAVGGRRSQPGRTCAQLVNAFLQDLAFLVFFVVRNLLTVLRGVLLAVRAVNTDLTEQTFHTKGTRFVSDDRNQTVFDGRVLQHHVQGTNESDSGGDLFVLLFQQLLEIFQLRQFQLLSEVRNAARQIAVQFFTLAVQVFVLFRTFREGDVREIFNLLVGHRHIETVADITHAVHVHFLHLVSDVFTFGGITHAIAFNGMGQDNGRFAFGFLRFFECSVDFLRIVAATVQGPNLIVSPVGNQCGSFRVFTEEVLANVRAVFGFEGLIVAVNGFVHQLDQFTAGVFTQQFVPTGTPHHLDHVPASTCEDAFQFVNDFAVTGYRAIQTLQVTVDNEDQVIQFFTGRDGDSAFGFRLIHLTVAQEGVNGLLGSVFQTTMLQIFQELSLIDRADRAQAHGYGRELPEFRHQFRVRVRRQTVAMHFLTEVVHLLFGQAAFQESTRVNARRDVALEVHQVAAVFVVARAEEVVEAHIIHGRGRLEGRHVAAKLQVFFRRAQHGHDGVPANSRANTTFQLQITRVFRFIFNGNSVDVVASSGTSGNLYAAFTGFAQELVNQILSTLNTFFTDYRFDRL